MGARKTQRKKTMKNELTALEGALNLLTANSAAGKEATITAIAAYAREELTRLRARVEQLERVEEAAYAITVSDGNMNADSIGTELLEALYDALVGKKEGQS